MWILLSQLYSTLPLKYSKTYTCICVLLLFFLFFFFQLLSFLKEVLYEDSSSLLVLPVLLDFFRPPRFSSFSLLKQSLIWKLFHSPWFSQRVFFLPTKLFSLKEVPEKHCKSENIEWTSRYPIRKLFSSLSSFNKHNFKLVAKQTGSDATPIHVFLKIFTRILNRMFLYY